jgi:hypothetical protein
MPLVRVRQKDNLEGRERGEHSARFDLGMILAVADILLVSNDQQALETETAHSVKLPLESLSIAGRLWTRCGGTNPIEMRIESNHSYLRL